MSRIVLAAAPGVECSRPEAGSAVFETEEIRISAAPAELEASDALAALCLDGLAIEQEEELRAGSGRAAHEWRELSDALSQRGMLCLRVLGSAPDRETLLEGLPLLPGFRFSNRRAASGESLVLSRYALLRREDGGLVCESPLSLLRVHIAARAAGLFLRGAVPRRLQEYEADCPGLASKEISACLEFLLGAGLFVRVDPLSGMGEDETPASAAWEYHDMFFHARSRAGRAAGDCGGTYRLRGAAEPEPARRPRPGGESVALYAPDIAALSERDKPFTQVLEQRQSERTFANDPLDIKQIGEFLYRAARVRSYKETAEGGLTSRPYPSGGAAYELELYPLIANCSGIERALYYYDPFDHRLLRQPAEETQQRRLLEAAAAATGGDLPDVLLLISARFKRVSWKYQSIAYSLILKHVGVLFQTMYLVSTAMDLHCCALGVGNSDEFCDAAGTEYWKEGTVGEFLLSG